MRKETNAIPPAIKATVKGFIYLNVTRTIITYKFKGILNMFIKRALYFSIKIFDFMIEFRGLKNPCIPLIALKHSNLVKKLSAK